MTGRPGVERVFRAEYGRAVAVLIRAFGDIDLAEEAVQDAFAEAVRRWTVDGTPPSPAGWIITTARNRAIDRLRRERSRVDKQLAAVRHDVADRVSKGRRLRPSASGADVPASSENVGARSTFSARCGSERPFRVSGS